MRFLIFLSCVISYLLFNPKFEPIHEDYEGVLRVLLNTDLLLFIGAVCLVLGGEKAMIAFQYFLYLCFCAARFVWLWAIQPGLHRLVTCLALSLARLALSLSSAAFSCRLALWPTKEPSALVLVPSFSIMMEPASSPVLRAVASPADSLPFERPFMRPAGAASSCAPAASDVPVVAPSSASVWVSAVPPVSVALDALALSSAPAASGVPAVAPASVAAPVLAVPPASVARPTPPAVLPAVLDASAACCASAMPPVPVVRGTPTKPAASAVADGVVVPAFVPAVSEVSASSVVPAAPANCDVPAVPVALLPLPAPRISYGRGVRFVVSSARGKNPGCRGAVRTQQKVGKTTPPCALRRAACAALGAGIVKPAPFCLPVPVAASPSLSAGVGSLLLASTRTVKVARKPVRRIVSVRRLLRPAVRVEIEQQKARVAARRRAVACRRRFVATCFALFARRAAVAVAAAAPCPSAPAVPPVWRSAAASVGRSVAQRCALKPARPMVSVRRLLHPAVREEIKQQKVNIVARRRAVACRRRFVATWFAVFARRAAAVSRSPAPAVSFGGSASPSHAFAFGVPGPVCRLAVPPAAAPVCGSEAPPVCPPAAFWVWRPDTPPALPVCRPPSSVAPKGPVDGVFALPAVPSCGGRPLAALSSARPKKASPLSQVFGPTQAASSSSTSSSSSVSSRRIAVPRRRRRGGKENEM